MTQSTDTIPIWLQAILKTIFGALLGTSIGVVWGGGAGCLWALNTLPTYNKALGGEDFQLVGLIFTIIASMITAGCIGFVIGALTTLVVHIRKSRRASQLQ